MISIREIQFDFASCLVIVLPSRITNHSHQATGYFFNRLVSYTGTKVQDPKTYTKMIGSVLDTVGMDQADQSINLVSSNINDDTDCWLRLTYTENEKKDQIDCETLHTNFCKQRG